MSFSEKIKKLRKEKNWTQDKLAEKLNTNGRLIGKYETGRVEPSASTLRKFAEVFEVSVDYLLFDSIEDKIIHKINDTDFYKRFEELENINGKDKELIIRMLDLFIRDNKTKETYSSIE